MASVRSSFSCPSPLPLPPPEIKYDVFLSFRGEDTRNNFTSHLYAACCDKEIDAFIDDQLRRGDEISQSLLRVIEESEIYIIIFSANYANSKWCLEELVKILECKKNHEKIVIPVFYEIDPSHVRNQTGSYAVAFAGHERRFKENLDKVQTWRRALKEAADLAGFDSHIVKPESKLVENIVEDVLKWLNNMPQCDNKDLVGIDSQIQNVNTMLRRGNVGIWGFGGVGKTTLANALFQMISSKFDSSYFAGNVREASRRDYELTYLRQNLLSELLKDKNARFGLHKKQLRRKKVLIILDDVSDFRQVEFLIGNPRSLNLESRIIITSRDKQVLKHCCMDDNIYEVKILCFSDALTLFCQNAFKQNHPDVDYGELSNNVVKMVGGVPLAVKVLGSSLFGKKKEVWENKIEKLEKNFDRHIHEVLNFSFEELDDDQQNIFLDIACFFRGWNVDHTKAFMKACGFFSDSGIDALVDKSLITIAHNKFNMHELLQAMGKEIIRQESSNNPGNRSRLWHHKDIYDVLTAETGTKTIEGISLDMSKSGDIYLHPRAFANMQNLRFLNFYNTDCCKNRVHVSQGLESIFTNLRYLDWYGCPLKSLQSNVLSKNLVELRMRESKVKELWNGISQLDNLKIIDLWGSQHLTRLPDLSKAANLESLDLAYCTSLTEIPSSIQHLPKLQSMDLRFCENLMSIPDCNGLKSLTNFNLDCCYQLKVPPKLPDNFEALNFIGSTSVREFLSYRYLNKLESFSFIDCKSHTGIQDFRVWKSPTNNNTYGCYQLLPKLPKSNLLKLPNNFEEFNFIDSTSFCDIPSDEHFNELKSFSFIGCKGLTAIPDYSNLKSLRTLCLTNCSKIDKLPDSLGYLTSLEHLYLNKTNLESIPESIVKLSKLRFLNISYCERLKVLPRLPWASITAVSCTSLEQISCPSFHNDKFVLHAGEHMIANFINCFKLDSNSLNNFVKDSLFKIQGQAPSTKKRFYHQVYRGFPLPFSIRYPGNEIPVWFEYQNWGSFIEVNLPPNWFNYNFLCFALCVVVANPKRLSVHHGENLCFPIKCECSVKSKDGDRPVVINTIMHWEDHSRSWGFALSSNHVAIGFGFHSFDELYGNRLSFQFSLESTSHREPSEVLYIDNYKVVKCGVHLM